MISVEFSRPTPLGVHSIGIRCGSLTAGLRRKQRSAYKATQSKLLLPHRHFMQRRRCRVNVRPTAFFHRLSLALATDWSMQVFSIAKANDPRFALVSTYSVSEQFVEAIRSDY